MRLMPSTVESERTPRAPRLSVRGEPSPDLGRLDHRGKGLSLSAHLSEVRSTWNVTLDHTRYFTERFETLRQRTLASPNDEKKTYFRLRKTPVQDRANQIVCDKETAILAEIVVVHPIEPGDADHFGRKSLGVSPRNPRSHSKR